MRMTVGWVAQTNSAIQTAPTRITDTIPSLARPVQTTLGTRFLLRAVFSHPAFVTETTLPVFSRCPGQAIGASVTAAVVGTVVGTGDLFAFGPLPTGVTEARGIETFPMSTTPIVTLYKLTA